MRAEKWAEKSREVRGEMTKLYCDKCYGKIGYLNKKGKVIVPGFGKNGYFGKRRPLIQCPKCNRIAKPKTREEL